MMEDREKEIARSVSSRAHPMDAQCANCGMSWGAHCGALCRSEKTLFSALLPIESKSSDGWVEWKGGECPVAKDVKVDIRVRCGKEYFGQLTCHWKHSDSAYDIVAYRILQEPAKEEPESYVPVRFRTDPNAAMISRDGPAIIREPKPTPAPISNVKPSVLGLTIVADRGHRFGSGF